MRKYGEIGTYTVAGVEVKKRYIVIAAIKKNGVVFTGLRHGHIIRDMVECGFLDDMVRDYVEMDEQGFVDDLGNYLTRKQARLIAIEAGQISSRHGMLYSEDLW